MPHGVRLGAPEVIVDSRSMTHGSLSRKAEDLSVSPSAEIEVFAPAVVKLRGSGVGFVRINNRVRPSLFCSHPTTGIFTEVTRERDSRPLCR
jgi:hypothetical protein